MSDKISTETIRSEYALQNAGWAGDVHSPAMAEKFDLWIEQHDAEIVKATELRIAEELESMTTYDEWGNSTFTLDAEQITNNLKGVTNE